MRKKQPPSKGAKGDVKRGVDTSMIVRTKDFDKPVVQLKKGGYKMKPGMVYLGFSTDFLIEEADAWRGEAWAMIRERSDCTFLMITKRIDRVAACLPADWGEGWPHVVLCCTCETQERADYRLPIYLSLPLCRREVICEPLLERLDLSRYLAEGRIDSVSCGGESGDDARVCDFDWVLDLRRQCVDAGVAFRFRQTGARLRKEGRIYRIRRQFQHSQARRAGVDFIVEG